MSTWLLAAAQIGTSLLSAQSATKAMEANLDANIERAGITAGRAAFAGPLERFQVRQVAESQGRARRDEFARSLGAQRASSAAAGIVGGRTQQLIEARSQAAFSRETALADQQTRFRILASREQEKAAMENARMQMSDAGRAALAQGNQITASFIGDLVGTASDNTDLFTSGSTPGEG